MTTDVVFAIFKVAVLLLVLAYAIYTMLQLNREDKEFERILEVQLRALRVAAWSPLSMPIDCRQITITQVQDATDDLTGDRYVHAMIEYDTEHWYLCRGFDVAPQVGDRAWLIMPMDDMYYITP